MSNAQYQEISNETQREQNVQRPTHGRGNWPKVRTQQELLEISKLRRSNKKLYEQQGKPIGEIFVHFGFSDERTLRIVRRMQGRNEQQAQLIGQVLAELGVVSQEDLICALCVQSGIIMVDLAAIPIPAETGMLIPCDTAVGKMVAPIGVHQDTLYLAVADPFNFKDAAFFTMLTAHKAEAVYAPHHEIVNHLAQKAGDTLPVDPQAKSVKLEADISENDAAIITLVSEMILNAALEGASDIHIEPFQDERETVIRFRRDGRMEHFSSFPRSYHRSVVSRIKTLSGLDIAERRQPQEGKIAFDLPEGGRINLRVSFIPGMHGFEFATLRFLATGEPLPLASLGICTRDMEVLRDATQHTQGLILVGGPNVSGKTTTLHSIINELNTPDRKIWTVEDPVEIVQPHLCQIQAPDKIGGAFDKMLRALLRADPDVIMLGEMRDRETAQIAVEASLSGHLVLSALRARSASDTVAQLLDMGTDPYDLSNALLSILAQRLARKLCHECAAHEEATARELEELADEYHHAAHGNHPQRAERETIIRGWQKIYAGTDGKLYLRRAVGCQTCGDGYKGRIGLYELLQITPVLRNLIRQQSSAAEYKAAGIAGGMRTLKQDGIEKVLLGITDITQVHSACA